MAVNLNSAAATLAVADVGTDFEFSDLLAPVVAAR
jgi:hypothetical protein